MVITSLSALVSYTCIRDRLLHVQLSSDIEADKHSAKIFFFI